MGVKYFFDKIIRNHKRRFSNNPNACAESLRAFNVTRLNYLSQNVRALMIYKEKRINLRLQFARFKVALFCYIMQSRKQ